MKVKVKVAFFDDNGIHKIGEVIEAKNFDEKLMELIEDKKPTVKKATKKD